MNRFIVLFEDDEMHTDQRLIHMDSHLEFLKENAAMILSAGPITHAESGTPAGGLWLVEASEESVVQELVKSDPFWPTGLRKKVEILLWNEVFRDGKRLHH